MQPLRVGPVLLDLKLHGIDGVELLARVRSDEDLKSLPVVVMTADGEQAQLGELSVEAFLTADGPPSSSKLFRSCRVSGRRIWSCPPQTITN